MRLIALALALAVSACVPPPGRPYPASSRVGTTGPADDELAREHARLGNLADARHRDQLERVERVARRLLSKIPDPPRVQFTVVQGDSSINAGATWGQVAVTSGMLSFIRSDDEMAVVLAHELAHLTQGHVTKGAMSSLALNILAIVIETQAPGAGQLAGGVGQMFLNRFTQSQERDADEVGLEYVYAAGYDPRAAAKVQERMAIEVPQTMAAGYFNTHPSSVERAVSARKHADELLAKGPPPGRAEVLALERAGEVLPAASDASQSYTVRPAGREREAPPRRSGGASAECDRARVYVDMARDAGGAAERERLYRRALERCPTLAEARAGLAGDARPPGPNR